ncbi:MBL fold metallo-hydrolase [uncultured Finegoldia sp.]|uniref:MBL fold metallo-hydrolase n=1 Tax=uncultured Finegoldia sp. TaxID=328009 RepID=UPI0026180038|nr:MBL fold metallo-hydrolase [uncultured Finegoldia sp.]
MYILSENGKCFVVDPGAQADDIIEYISNRNLEIQFILLTHGHFDHIFAVEELKNKLNTVIYASEREKDLLEDPEKNYTRKVGNPITVKADYYVKDGDTIPFNDSSITVMETPGHTYGSVCYIYKNEMFSGDMLFKNSIGRYDLPTASFEDIKNSIERLKLMNDDINVYPGHGPSTTIGDEKKYNPYFK